jgi:methionine-rich copper-binding protein CopC
MLKKFFIVLALLALPVGVSAHAYPLNYAPEAYAVLSKAPEEVMIRMSQGLAPTGHGVSIYGPGGMVLPAVASLVDPRDDRALRRAVTDMGEGTYTVSWHGVSREDGHMTRGAFSFVVGTSTVVASSVVPKEAPTAWLLIPLSLVSVITFLLCVLQVFVLSSKKEVWRLVAQGERTMSAVALQSLPFACVLGMLWYLSARGVDAALATLWGQVLLLLTIIVCAFFVLVLVGSRTRRARFACGVCTWSYAWSVSAITGTIALLSMWLFFLAPPTYTFPPWSIEKISPDGRMVIADSMHDPMSILLRAHQATGKLRTVAPEVVVHESTRGIGPMVIPVTMETPGNFMIPGSMLAPDGTWHIAVTIREEGMYDHSETFVLEYPRDLTTLRDRAMTPEGGVYRLGIFLGALFLMGVGILTLVWRLEEVETYDTLHHRQVSRALIISLVLWASLCMVAVLLVRLAMTVAQ